MTTEEAFTAACHAISKNDPLRTKVDLADYDSLLLDRKRVQQVVQALEKNTFVEDLTLPGHLSVHSTLQLNHFLKTSSGLRRLSMYGKEEDEEDTVNDELKETIKASIVFESISRSSLLVNLCL
jgi:hypothetical protein